VERLPDPPGRVRPRSQQPSTSIVWRADLPSRTARIDAGGSVGVVFGLGVGSGVGIRGVVSVGVGRAVPASGAD
jgi:hypothetical protein